MIIKGLSLVKPYQIEIKEFDLEEPKEEEVQIKTAFSGICGSDIAYYKGQEKYLGDDMWGHEGIGEIVKVGDKVKKFKIGDKVSSNWHPAFREYYNAPQENCIKIPKLSKRYILQCVSCPMNALLQANKIKKIDINKDFILVIGSGFTAYTFAQILKGVDVYGKYNENTFRKIFALNFYKNREELRPEYDIIISCEVTLEPYEIIEKHLKVGGLFIHFATPREPFTTQFEEWNWKNFKVLFPSPRGKEFPKAIKKTLELIENQGLDMDILYSKGYSFENALMAFDDFVNKRVEGEFKYYLKV